MNIFLRYVFLAITSVYFYNNCPTNAQDIAVCAENEDRSYEKLIELLQEEKDIELKILGKNPRYDSKESKQYLENKFTIRHKLWLLGKSIDKENIILWQFGVNLLRKNGIIKVEKRKEFYNTIEKVLLFCMVNRVEEFNKSLADLLRERIIAQNTLDHGILPIKDATTDYRKIVEKFSGLQTKAQDNGPDVRGDTPYVRKQYKELMEILKKDTKNELIALTNTYYKRQTSDWKTYLQDKLDIKRELWSYGRKIDKKNDSLWGYGLSLLKTDGLKLDHNRKNFYRDIEKVLLLGVGNIIKFFGKKTTDLLQQRIIVENDLDNNISNIIVANTVYRDVLEEFLNLEFFWQTKAKSTKNFFRS